MRTWSDGSSVWTLQVMHVEHDPVRNQTTRWLRYEKWTDGSLQATELQIFRLQQWSLTEFTTLLERAGFVEIEITADYSPGHEPRADSDIWTLSARRG